MFTTKLGGRIRGVGHGIRYLIGSEGAVLEVARVASDKFVLKVAKSPFLSTRVTLMSGQR